MKRHIDQIRKKHITIKLFPCLDTFFSIISAMFVYHHGVFGSGNCLSIKNILCEYELFENAQLIVKEKLSFSNDHATMKMLYITYIYI